MASCATFTPAFAQTTNVVSRVDDNVLTEQDIQNTMTIDGIVLATPLSPAEKQQARQNIIAEFNKDPAAFTKSKPLAQKMLTVIRNGSELERRELSVALWCRWNGASSSDPLVARWVEMMRRHNPPIVSSGDLVVTQRQIDALFASNDWVAQTVGLPTSTPQSRAAYAAQVRHSFASLPAPAKEALAHADLRWFALQDPILDHTDLHAKAVSLVRKNVHSLADVPKEARSLENDGLQFHAAINQFAQNMARIGGVGTVGATQAEGINFATRKFMGMGR